MLTAFAIWSRNVVVFGLLFWELDAGGPAVRVLDQARAVADFQFPQDEKPQLSWRPQVLPLRIPYELFSPTDAMPLSLRAKAAMGVGSVISATTILLVAARAVNVLGS